ncbi:putative periplasmic pilin chaperone [Escherichia coli]|nr:putative periplasmic pilin chaperone [Escherichia coli]
MKGLLSLLIFSMVLPAHAGIVIYGTRIIYPAENKEVGNDSNLLIVFYVQIMPDDFVMQLHRF